MSESDLSTLILGWITAYGLPMVGGLLLVGAMGLPIPCTLIVIVSGAFVRLEYLDTFTTPLLALLASVAGDSALYGLGRFANRYVERRFGGTTAWKKAEETFERRGGLATFLTRWLLTALAMPTTLVAGTSGYPFRKFLAFDFTGEIVWVALFGGLGYLFGSQWEEISAYISEFSGWILGVAIFGIGVYLLLRFGSRKKTALEPQESLQAPSVSNE